MKYFEKGKELITLVVLSVVGMIVVGAMGYGAGSYLYSLGAPNATACPNWYAWGNCTGGYTLSAVQVISGTVVPIIFLIGLGMKFL